ncbi:uncharacterized protein LOC131861461 [Cryptomeria japonica]|uniref:uncharacterized protein LOC131861461 n=1 Tax=Cryptomeria japonica TaxID=3369 RepID=UPI0027D9F2EC|nr:uncharacterized protein LOC131861461 [Cryptomeria japonica]
MNPMSVNGNNGNNGKNGNENNRNKNNNNENGGGGNNGNNSNNRGNGNYQNKNYGCRPPMTIEMYKQLDFSGIVGYLNQISSDLRSAIPKFIGNGTDSAEQHVARMEALDVARIEPLVLVANIQRVNPQGKDGRDQPIQLWVSLWDSRYDKSHYVRFDEFFVKPLFKLEELANVVDDLETILEERKRRLGGLEGEEEQDVESDPGENEIVSKLQVLEKEDELDAQDKIVATLNIDSDARLDEHTSFVSDDEFVKSKEFKSFLYHFKGKKLRDAMPDVTPENEAEMLRKMKAEINFELEHDPSKGKTTSCRELEAQKIYYEKKIANEFVAKEKWLAAKEEQLVAKDEEMKTLEDVTRAFEKFVDGVNNANVVVKEEFVAREKIMSMFLSKVQESTAQLAPPISDQPANVNLLHLVMEEYWLRQIVCQPKSQVYCVKFDARLAVMKMSSLCVASVMYGQADVADDCASRTDDVAR